MFMMLVYLMFYWNLKPLSEKWYIRCMQLGRSSWNLCCRKQPLWKRAPANLEGQRKYIRLVEGTNMIFLCLENIKETTSGLYEFTSGFKEVRVARSIVFCVMFWISLFVHLSFLLGHCVVCPSIYGFLLLLWYLQTFLVTDPWFSLGRLVTFTRSCPQDAL
jgi:hypothetical protein